MRYIMALTLLFAILLYAQPLYAQSPTLPLYCLGGVPCGPSTTPTPTLYQPAVSPSPRPSLSQSLTVSPTIDPCSVSQASTQSAKKHRKHRHGDKNGFFSQLFARLFQLIRELLQKLGIPGTSPIPTPSPTPAPSIGTPLPSSNPCQPTSTQAPTQPTATTSPTTPQTTNTPTTKPTGRTYPWHTNIVTTTFWVGELFNTSLADGSQVCSAYDSNWAYHWSGINSGTVPANATACPGAIIGGCDGVPGANNACSTEKRTAANGYFPTKVTPKQNPFYLDLPYDDVNDSTAYAQRCQVIPWANDSGYAGNCTNKSFSYMKNRWVRIVGPNNQTCYGQIEDAGPSHDNLYHDAAYVFGTNDIQPIQGQFNNAGADVSPALNGCLGFSELDGQNDKIKWQFVDDGDVPAGPWKNIVTTSQVQ